jgi:hypothetical protein
MDQANVSFLENQAVKFMSASFGAEHSPESLFQVQFDPLERQLPKTNWDEIMFHRVLPMFIGKSLSLHEACRALTNGINEIPLWIRVIEVEKDKLYSLLISKRFRKLKALRDWHQNNQFLPFTDSMPA